MPIQAANLYATVSVAGAETSVGQLRRVSDQVNRTQGVMGRLSQNAGQVGRGLGQVAGGLTRIGTYAAAAALTAVGASAKIAISFEDAFATVEKTVDGTTAELAKIDRGLRTLSTTIPVTFQALTSIASEAGALGIATKDIAKFTEAVARTSAATVGLDPFQASEAFGKLTTIFGLAGDRIDATTGKVVSDYDRLGSALVALGNAGASSEVDIIAVTKRFAAAGHIAGLSAAEVLGWSSALASLGPEAEAAGGALQRLFNRAARNIGLMGEPGLIGKNAQKRVETFARVTGMTVDEFAKLYAKDASLAMQKFIQGLQGMDQFQSARALFEAGVINQRDILAIQAFSSRFPILAKQLQIANDAWKKGTDLQDISEKRFDTLKSKAIEFKNEIILAAAEMGDGLTPAVGRLVAKVKEFVQLHLGDIRQLGVDIGKAIDDINWGQVKQGAQTFVDILKAGFDLLKQVPPQIALMTAGFIGLNRLSGGLLGAGLGNIAGGVLKGAGNLLLAGVSRIPGIGGAIGAVTAQRVFVVNWPIGFGGPGVPGALAVGGAGFVTGTLLPLLAGGAVVAAVGMLVARVAHESYPDLFVDPSAPAGPMGSGAPRGFRQFDRHGNPINRVPASPTNPYGRPGLANTSGSPDDRFALRYAFEGAISGARIGASLADIARNTSGSPDERDALRQIARNTSLAAVRLGVMAGIRITGKVPSVAALSHIGEPGDPFGFKHLKAFSFGEIPKREMRTELVEHLEEINREIRKASAKGDTATVNKLRETKAGLEFLLRQVRAGTFHAGQRAYDGALVAAAAADRTTVAVENLPTRMQHALFGGLQYTGIPWSPTSGTGGGAGGHGPARRKAMGDVGLARMPYEAMFGEAGDEGVAIIRNPRRFEGWGGGTEKVVIHPQAVKLSLNGRDLVNAMIPYSTDPRRRLA